MGGRRNRKVNPEDHATQIGRNWEFRREGGYDTIQTEGLVRPSIS